MRNEIPPWCCALYVILSFHNVDFEFKCQLPFFSVFNILSFFLFLFNTMTVVAIIPKEINIAS